MIKYRIAMGVLVALVLSGCKPQDDQKRAGSSSPDSTQACPANNAGITVPAGFCVTIFADSLGDARHIAIAPNGDVYVVLQGTEPSPEEKKAGQTAEKQPAAVIGLRDTTHDGVADVVARIGTRGNTGVAVYNNFLYVDEGTQIVRYPLPQGQLAPTGAAEVVVSGIPLNPGHRARNFAIGSDGTLIVNVGSATNSCQQQDRTPESKGVDPCTELNTRAGLWRFDANKTAQKFTPGARYVTGLRNGMGIAWGPDGKLYATQHGRDQLHDNWQTLFPDTKYQAENPAEELVQVNQGDDYGWPYCYYAVDQKKLVTAPEYGGDGKKDDRCRDKKAPVAAYPGHWAPMSLLFYSGTQFPERYRGGAFIAFHGSWNRAPDPQAGYRVVYQPMSGGATSGNYETFADNFAELQPPALQPGSAHHRPLGLAQGPDGALYITDDVGGRVYRVTYGGK